MKKEILLLLFCLFPFSAIHADITWKLERGTLTISGTYMHNYDIYGDGSNKAPWFNDRHKIEKVVFEDRMTNIGDYAFYDCSSLTSIEIPNSVTSIGNYAFYSCASLTSIEIPNSVTSIGNEAFYYCEDLTSIEIPNSVMSIGNEAFEGCSGLTSITVEKGNTKYDSRDNCNAIIETNSNKLITGCKNTVIPNSVTCIEAYAFQNCEDLTSVEIPNSVTSIGRYAFEHCSSLTSVNIPNSVTSIGNDAFELCVSLTSVTIPNSVTSIGDRAFYQCQSLHSVEIPNSVTSIGRYAFQFCSNLTSIEIPNSVTSIGDGAFGANESLTSITVEKGNTKYDSRDNCNAIIETNSNKLIQGCKNTVIPNSVTSIEAYAFQNCTDLTSVEIPNSVTSIGDGAFQHCSGLTSIEIPNSVTSIGDYAFYSCASLTSVEIPNSVTSIGKKTFYYCEDLTSITFKGSTPPEFGEDVFEYVNASFTIYVPANSIEAYKNVLGGLGLSDIKALPLIYLKDGEAYTQDSQIDGMDIYYTRNFANTNWQAIYLPFSLKYEDWKDDFEVARINGIHQYDDYNIGSINRTELEVVKMTNDDSVIYPNTPYLIRAKTPGEKTLSIENTTVYESKANSIECSTTTELFTFIGTYKVMNFSGIGAYHNCYVLGSTGRNIIEGKTFLPPYRWFMKMDERESVYGIKNNTAKEISIKVVGEETTGIANIQHASPNTQTYDLNGRRVNENNLKPGMYVKNGRKVVIK